MLYMYHVHVIVYANKDDADDYYYIHVNLKNLISSMYGTLTRTNSKGNVKNVVFLHQVHAMELT